MARTIDENNYNLYYEIKDNGMIFSLKNDNYLKPVKQKTGYLSVTLCVDGKRKQHSVHRLVAKIYLKNPYNKPCVNHIDGNKHNNKVNNLEWCTYGENIKHAYENGLMKAASGVESHMFGKKHSENTKDKIKEALSKNENAYNVKSYIFNKDGVSVLIKNMNSYCKENNLSQSCMFRLMKGERKKHKGYYYGPQR